VSPQVGLSLLPALLLLSAFFSGSETALFSLTREDRAWLGARGTGSARCVLDLLEQPRTLLVAVLFGNLLVNFLLFATAARAFAQLGGGGAIVAGGVATTAAVIVLGEVTPKSVAVTTPRRFALLTAPPLLLFRDLTRLFGVIAPLERLVGWLLDRVEVYLPSPAGALSEDELRRFVALEAEQGQIERKASELLADVLALGSRRVHEVMTPRVDLVAHDLTRGRGAFLELVRRYRLGRVPVHDGGGLDTVRGYLSSREVLARPGAEPGELVHPIWFVPHTKSLESLLREMIERDEGLAIVVGEFGGTEGLVTREDVIEEITGDIAREDARPLVEGPLADGSWRMAGRFPLRDAAELLGVSMPVGPTTLSGFVAHALGRIPEVGDLVWHAGVEFRVDAVQRRRATQVRVALPRPPRLPASPLDPGEVAEELTQSGAHRADVRLRRWVAESSPDHEASGPPEDAS